MQLLKSQFKENLVATLEEVVEPDERHYIQEAKFSITTVLEPNVKYNSVDDYMNLWSMSDENLKDRLFTLGGVIDILCGPKSSYPLWINVISRGKIDAGYLFELEISKRFRKPSELKNIETGHPPFKIKFTGE